MKISFSSHSVKPETAYEVLPVGAYLCQIESIELRSNAAGTGSYLRFEYVVMVGAHNGRKIFDNLNIQNPNPKAMEIAKSRLAAICIAVGIPELQDTDQLLGKRLMVSVKHEMFREERQAKVSHVSPYHPGQSGAGPSDVQAVRAQYGHPGVKHSSAPMAPGIDLNASDPLADDPIPF